MSNQLNQARCAERCKLSLVHHSWLDWMTLTFSRSLDPGIPVYPMVNALSSRLQLADESKATAWRQWPAPGKDPISVCVWALEVSQEGRHMLKTYIVRLKTSLYEVERRGFVLCSNEGASVLRVLMSFPWPGPDLPQVWNSGFSQTISINLWRDLHPQACHFLRRMFIHFFTGFGEHGNSLDI